MDEPSWCQKFRRKACRVLAGALAIYLVVVVLVQAAMYEWATMHCSAKGLENYAYPGGGEANLVPLHSLITEQDPRWWGSSFINFPADKEGLSLGASTGVYYRTWGPIFWTYTFQDIMSKETFVVRDRPIALGGSHKISRCDGQGPVYVVTEGSHYFMNIIRSIFGMYSSRVYNIWEDNKLVALSAKQGGTGQSHKEMVFREPNDDNPFATAYLKERHFHGRFDSWFVAVDKDSPLPAFVPNAVTALMAFATASLKNHTKPPGEMLELLEELPLPMQQLAAAETTRHTEPAAAPAAPLGMAKAEGVPSTEVPAVEVQPRVEEAVAVEVQPRVEEAVAVVPEPRVEAAVAVEPVAVVPEQHV